MNAGRVALVTGGARGLGRAIAERLGRDGMAVVVSDVIADRVVQTAAELEATGISALGIAADVTDESAMIALMRSIDERHGRLDVLVNSAGIQGLDDEENRPLVEEMSVELWRRTIDINLTGTFIAAKCAIPMMRRGKWGRIINISSRAARMRTGLGNSNYAASKSGLLGFSRVMAGEVGRDGITVNCIAPGRMLTEMTRSAASNPEYSARTIADTAVGRMAETGDVAASISFLCSDEASLLTGLVVDVNGGSYMA